MEYARGGYIGKSSGNYPPYMCKGFIISKQAVKKEYEELLKELNSELDKPDEDVIE